MAITFDKNICNYALKLLRQDVEIADGTSTPIGKKCAAVYDIAYDAVSSGHDWSAEMDGSTPTDSTLKRLLIYSVARELAIMVTGRQSDHDAMNAAYNEAFVRAVRKDLEKKIANDDPVLAQLVTNFVGKDEMLPYTYSIYSNRKDAVNDSCENEVKTTLGIKEDDDSTTVTDVPSTTAAADDNSADEEEDKLDGLARACVDTLMVAKLAPACGLDANFVQLKMAEYQAKITEWRKLQLNDALKDSTDGVLLQLVANFKSDDAGLVNAFTVYTQRSAQLKTACENEVKATLGLSSLDNDDLAKACVDTLMVAKLAPACGLDANFVQLKMAEYQAKITEWRKIKLNDALAKENDPVLLMLLGNFKSDDAGLVNAYDVYKQRRDAVKAESEVEINNEHDWRTPFAANASAHPAKAAYQYLCASKLALSVGTGADFASLMIKKYTETLESAKIMDFEDAISEETDGELVEAIGLFRQYSAKDGAVPFGWPVFVRKYNQIKDGVREECLNYFGWSFCKRIAKAKSTAMGNRFVTGVPADCRAVLVCEGENGDTVSTIMNDHGMLVSNARIETITYATDDGTTEHWPMMLKKAYVFKLAAAMASAMPTQDSLARAQTMHEKAEALLSDLRQEDARKNRADTSRAVLHNRYTAAYKGVRHG